MVWQEGSFARVLQFNKGVLVSLAAVSQFRE